MFCSLLLVCPFVNIQVIYTVTVILCMHERTQQKNKHRGQPLRCYGAETNTKGNIVLSLASLKHLPSYNVTKVKFQCSF